MVVRKEFKMQRELNFAIIDEVDSILIDEARTPLIISGRGNDSGELYKTADAFVRTIGKDDYTIEEKEKTVMLTDSGVEKAERYFRVDNITDIDNADLYSHIQRALKAHFIMKKDRDYIVSDGEVLIVDEFTGRVLVGRRYSDGLHQAVEAKEHVPIRSENKTLATITFQNFFRMYRKLSGMTGTAKTEEEEFKGIYSLDVVTIPPNLPSRRRDENDSIYTTEEGKFRAIIADINDCVMRGQPVLVGTVSVEKSEALETALKNDPRFRELRAAGKVADGKVHVLNAKKHKEEASIIAQAGKLGAVTIATNMAGRGTDIMLGGNPEALAKADLEKMGYEPEIIEMAASPHAYDERMMMYAEEKYKEKYPDFQGRCADADADYEAAYNRHKEKCDEEKEQVIAAGGLRVIGTERHESRRIDNQLRGRSGRQGDPGGTKFYISLQDDVARIFGGDKLKAITETMKLDDDTPISNAFITKQIERAQRMVENRNFSVRKQVLSYDDVMNAQRELIYKERGKVLDGLDVHDQVVDMIGELAEEIIGYYADYKTDYNTWDYEAFNTSLEQRMLPPGSDIMTPELCSCYDVYKLKDAVMKVALETLEQKKKEAEALGVNYGDIERMVLLRSVDRQWMDHIDAMDALRRGIGLRGYGQRDPVVAYRQEGWDMFEDMVSRIHTTTAGILLKATLTKREPQEQRRPAPGAKHSAPQKSAPARSGGAKVGRNDPCPCGSGKKYKNCCGKNA